MQSSKRKINYMKESMELLNNMFAESFFLTISPLRIFLSEFFTSMGSGVAAALGVTVLLGVIAEPIIGYLQENMPSMVDVFIRLRDVAMSFMQMRVH